MATIIPGLYGLDSASAWRALTKDPNKYVERFAKNKTVQKEIDYFNKKAPTFDSIDALMKDRRALQYVLDSYGLGSEINNAGRIKKILSENPTDANSLVNKLMDPRFKAMAESLRLDEGMSKLQRLSFRDTMEEKYIQNEFEEALGEQDTALRQAAYFARNANGIASVYNLMGDQILRNVVTSAFNLPPQLAIQPIETQAKVIAGRVDVTKFGNAAGSAVTTTQLTRAKSDHALISNSLAVSDAALKQMTTLQTYLDKVASDYATLSSRTDPMGSNSALIAVQKDAVPDLIRYEEMMRKGDETLDSVSSTVSTLHTLIAEAKKPGADLVALKAQFDSLATSINDRIDNSVSETYAGSENILMNGSNDTITLTIGTGGETVTINRFDSTSIKNLITTANTAFDAITGSGDTTNIFAAEARLLRAMDDITAIQTHITDDFNALDTMVSGSMDFVATLHTEELMSGKKSVDDALSRITRIEDLLSRIGALATESKNMAPLADRTELETQYNAYRAQLRSLVENTGEAGMDNFLNGIGDQSYEIVDGKHITVKGGIDLAATISDILDSNGLGDQTAAAALETQAIMLTNRTDTAKASLEASKPVMDRVINVYDPRGKLDSQIADLRTYVDVIINGAAVDGKNLLDSDQTTIRLDGLSSGASLSFRAQSSFKDDFTAALSSVLDEMGNGISAITSALYNVTDVVDRAKRTLGSDNRVGTIEQGKLGATIDALDPNNISEASTLYKTNAFTQKFLTRYLTLAGSSGGNTQTHYLSNLFSGGDAASATANLMSLALSIKA